VLASDGFTQPAQAPAGDELFATFLTEVRSLTADFRQELWTADQRLLETANGSVSLKRPNHFLWRYAEPIEQSVIANGRELWMYDVELAQATLAPLDEAGPSPALLLSGDEAVRDGFEVVRSFALDGLDWIELAPKIEGADFTSVLIGFEGRTPQRLELVDGLNQVTRIELSNVALNPDLPDALFEFEPPPGVDVIGGG
jgi:outer membrane lipoprotein carrier protein